MRGDLRTHTGSLVLHDDVLRNRSTWFGDWDLPISRIRLIGEATDENGPFADDWYFVFAEDNTGWWEVSCYATGARELVSALNGPLGSHVGSLGLQSSATFNSRVLWPPRLVDRPVFEYVQDGPRNLLERVIHPLIKPARNIQRFTAEVEQFLRTAADPPRR
jgi:hypothetical protein